MKSLVLALVAVLSAQSAMAADVYQCSVKKNGRGNWIPEFILISHDTKNNSVVVIDPVIDHFHGGPIKGRLDIDNKVRTTFRWKVRAKDKSSQHGTLGYAATYQKASGKVTVSMFPAGYDNSFSGKGTCTKKSK